MKRFIVTTALLTLTASAAHAGKLAEGFRGLNFGKMDDIPKPDASCAANPEETVRWGCRSKVGDASVNLAYFYQYGWFTSVLITGDTYGDCKALRDVLVQAYGTPRATKSYGSATDMNSDVNWRDGDNLAAWSFNQFSDKCQVLVWSDTAYRHTKAAEKLEAKKAVNDL